MPTSTAVNVTRSAWSNTYTSFSGIDIRAVITVPKGGQNTEQEPIELGTLQAISYSITREKA